MWEYIGSDAGGGCPDRCVVRGSRGGSGRVRASDSVRGGEDGREMVNGRTRGGGGVKGGGFCGRLFRSSWRKHLQTVY